MWHHNPGSHMHHGIVSVLSHAALHTGLLLHNSGDGGGDCGAVSASRIGE